jgi:hypothetical protein
MQCTASAAGTNLQEPSHSTTLVYPAAITFKLIFPTAMTLSYIFSHAAHTMLYVVTIPASML